MKVHQAEEVGMSSERLARIDRYLEGEVENDRLPGIIALAQRRGKVIHNSIHGNMDIAAKRPMQADTLFRIYSMTKPIVSLALMMLHDEGKLQLHDKVSRYIPSFAKTRVFSHVSESQPQLRQAGPALDRIPYIDTYGRACPMPAIPGIRSTGCISEVLAKSIGFFRRDMPLAELVEHFAELPLSFQPGSSWQYSVATDVVGYLVEVISGMPLADFLKERIFAPLGMVDTDFYVPPEKAGRLAAIYGSPTNVDPQLIDPNEVANGDVRVPTTCPSGGGGLVSSTADYLRFASMLLNGGELDGVRLVSPMTIKRMTTNAVPREMLPLRIGIERYGYGFGLGFRVMVDYGRANGYSSPGEFGWAGAASTYFVIDPQEDLLILMMTQMWCAEPHRPRSIFPNLVYQAIDESYAD